jgi:high-affinity iron transporter
MACFAPKQNRCKPNDSEAQCLIIASFVIIFREALEAALIVGIVSAYLTKIHHSYAKRYLYAGAVTAVTASVILAWMLRAIVGNLAEPYRSIFEGATALTAAGFLTYMVLWMSRNSRSYKGELERKLDLALTGGQLLSVGMIAFVAVFREGIETALFLTALFFADPSGTLVGILLGLIAVFLVTAVILKGSRRIDLHAFFKYTSVILVIFAAGLVAFASHEMMDAAEKIGFDTGILGQQAFQIHVAPNSIFYEEGTLGTLLSSLFGYTLGPEWIRVAVYLGYWLIIGAYLMTVYRHVSTETDSQI